MDKIEVYLHPETIHYLLAILDEHAHGKNTFNDPSGWAIMGGIVAELESVMYKTKCVCENCQRIVKENVEMAYPTSEGYYSKEIIHTNKVFNTDNFISYRKDMRCDLPAIVFGMVGNEEIVWIFKTKKERNLNYRLFTNKLKIPRIIDVKRKESI